MPKRTIKNGRKLMLLKWIEALDDGYEEHQETKQPATVSNLAGFLVHGGCYKETLRAKFSRRQISSPADKAVYKRVKMEVSDKLRRYYGTKLLSKGTVYKGEENHLLMRNGVESMERKVTSYSITGMGKRKANNLMDYFEERNKVAKKSTGDITYDTVVFPQKGRQKWRIKEFQIPRVIDGECVDTGTKVDLPAEPISS